MISMQRLTVDLDSRDEGKAIYSDRRPWSTTLGNPGTRTPVFRGPGLRCMTSISESLW
jgi:hypothetical protein